MSSKGSRVMKTDRMAMALVAALVALALVCTVRMIRTAPEHRALIERKARDLAHIDQLVRGWSLEEQYRSWLEDQGSWYPADLEMMASRRLGAGAVSLTPRPAVSAADGWLSREVEMVFADTSFEQAADMLTAVESVPPWRLKWIELRSSGEAGRGSVVAILEALEKEQP